MNQGATCRGCGKPFFRIRPNHLFCSQACGKRQRRRGQNQASCAVCGRPLRRRYCSRDCARQAQKAQQRQWREKKGPGSTRACKNCGLPFERIGKRVYCKPGCAREGQKARKRERTRLKDRLLTCAQCGNPFLVKSPSKRKRFCSDKCGKRFQWRKQEAQRREARREKHGSAGTVNEAR